MISVKGVANSADRNKVRRLIGPGVSTKKRFGRPVVCRWNDRREVASAAGPFGAAAPVR